MNKSLTKILVLFVLIGQLFNQSLQAKSDFKIGSIPEADSLEMVAFWTALDGPNWTSIQWDLTQPISTWGGVTVIDNAITRIDLSNFGSGNGLSGHMYNINITSLEYLELRSNNISGEIPNFNLPALERLGLRSNDLTSEVPNFDGMPNLRELDLGQNALIGNLPSFEFLTSLEFLNLQSNDLSGTIPTLVLPQLQTLYLSSNNFEGEIPDFDLPSLVFLNISENDWVAPIPNFSTLPNLEELYFFGCNSLNSNLPDFQNLQNLVTIWADHSSLTGSVPDFDLPNLEILRLDYNQLEGPLPNFDLPNLKILELNNNQITGPIPSYNLPSLEKAELNDNQLIGSFPGDMVLPSLVNLNARNNQIGGILPLLNLPVLEILDLYNNQLEGEIPMLDLPQLVDIDLSFNKLTGFIPDLDLPNLEILDLVGDSLSGEIPDFTALPSLRFLNLNGNLLTGEIPDFTNVPLLRWLNCGENQLSGSIPNFTALPNLLQIGVQINNLTGPLPNFENCPNIAGITASYNQLEGPLPDLGHLPLSNFKAPANNFTGCFPNWLCDVLFDVELQWNPGLPDEGSEAAFNDFCTNPGTQFGLPCDDGDPTTNGEVIQPDCSCSTINSFTNFVSGKIFIDTLENCAYDANEIPLDYWVISATNGNETYYGAPDSLGDYIVYTDTGNYVLQVAVPSTIWELCPGIQDLPLDFSNPDDTLALDIPVAVEVFCPIMNVDVGTPLLRICTPANYTVNYCNLGSTIAEDAQLEITFDDLLDINFSSIPWTTQDGQTLFFDLGDIAPSDCGSFYINVTPNCDSTELGQTLCVTTHIFPDFICEPINPLWDGSTTALLGACESDSVKFVIQNTGDNDMSMALGYIIIEDDLILRSGNFIIPAGESDSTSVEATGATFRMEAEQAAYHPTLSMPSIAIEGCVDAGGSSSTGFVNVFSQDDADLFVSTHCAEIIGSYDPNDKQGFPLGFGPNHIINDSTEIEYFVRFQNTGTDTAFLVVVKDAISEFLDPSTIRMGAASHPYEWTINGTGVLEVTFDNIMLPDSNVNEVASHGFFKFKIKQAEDNAPGTIINNEVAIYFDFNLPVITNETEHMIEEKLVVYDTVYTINCEPHWFYDSDTIINVYSSFEYYDLYQTNVIQFGEQDIVYIDTVLFNNTPYNGVIYETDTTLTFNHVNVSGCDSTTYVNISLLTNVFDAIGKQEVKLYPNPTNDKVYVLLQLSERVEVKELTLHNQLGQVVRRIDINQGFSEGEHLIPVNTQDLSPGVYFLSLSKQGEEVWIEKLLIE